MTFKTFVETPNAMLHVTGRYQARWNSETEFEFKISKIDLLSDVRNKLTKFLTLEVSTLEVDDKLISNIQTVLDKHQGKTKVRIKFIDEEENIVVAATSAQKTIELSNELFSELDAIRVVYGLN